MNVRLIDADALVNVVETARKKARTLTGMDFVMVTEKQPVIDAIPVEWLNDKMLDLQNKDKALSTATWLVLYEWKKEQEAR